MTTEVANVVCALGVVVGGGGGAAAVDAGGPLLDPEAATLVDNDVVVEGDGGAAIIMPFVVIAGMEVDGIVIVEEGTSFGVVTAFVGVVGVIVVVGLFGMIVVVGVFIAPDAVGVFGVGIVGVGIVDCTAVVSGKDTAAAALVVVTGCATTTVLAGSTTAAGVGVDAGGIETVVAADRAKGSAQQYEGTDVEDMGNNNMMCSRIKEKFITYG